MRYVAVDSGKYKTKISFYDTETKEQKDLRFRTKIGPGDFNDDLLEKGSFIVRVDGGEVYKVGSSARMEAELETTKKSEAHRICTLTGIALALQKDTEDVPVAIGIPLSLAYDPAKRMEYKEYILGEGTHTVEIKCSPEEGPHTVTFKIGKKLVYPESIGALYVMPEKLDGISGVIDIGNLNTNCTYCTNFMPQQDKSFTDELGGEILITELAQALSDTLGNRVDNNLVAATLLKPLKERFLTAKNGNDEIKEKSRKVIDTVMAEHAENIKRRLDARKWPTAFMNICMIGGTVKILKPELETVFPGAIFPDEPEMVNARGFLSKMCANDDINIFATKRKIKEGTKEEEQ